MCSCTNTPSNPALIHENCVQPSWQKKTLGQQHIQVHLKYPRESQLCSWSNMYSMANDKCLHIQWFLVN